MSKFGRFIVGLVVFLTTVQVAEFEETCDVVDATARVLCEVLAKGFPQNNGKFAKDACGCSAAFLKKDYSLCTAQESEFAIAPKCGKLYKSKVYQKFCQKDDKNVIDNYVINVVFKKGYRVCEEKDENKLINDAMTFLAPGIIPWTLDFFFETQFSKEVAALFSDCYNDVVNMPKEQNDTNSG